MFVDASALVAIVLEEPAAEKIAEALESRRPQRLITNVVAVWEVAAALRARRGGSFELVEKRHGQAARRPRSRLSGLGRRS